MSKADSPAWRTYEKQISQLIAALDENAEVSHNKQIKGRLSDAMSQVDVWVRGNIIGQDITIAIECKMVSRPLEIGAIDEFVGKLLDLGADRGVLYSASGMTVNAVHRAEGAISPSVIPISLQAAPSPTPWGAPGPPDGPDEPDYPEWLTTKTYRQILIGKQWIKAILEMSFGNRVLNGNILLASTASGNDTTQLSRRSHVSASFTHGPSRKTSSKFS